MLLKKMTMDTNQIKKKMEDAKDYLSGVEADVADGCKESAKKVDKYTQLLNNNHAGDNDYVKDA